MAVGIFQLVQIFLINWIADCFHMHTWFALSVFFCNRKIFARHSLNLELVQIFLINWIVLLGIHDLHCLFSFIKESFLLRQLESGACPNILDQFDCYGRQAWFALSLYLQDAKFLLMAVGILSLSNYP